jgi:hypothetical protein
MKSDKRWKSALCFHSNADGMNEVSGSLYCSHVRSKNCFHLKKIKTDEADMFFINTVRFGIQCFIIRKLHMDEARLYEYLILIQRFSSVRSRRRWKDNIKTDLTEIGWGCTGWIHLVQDRDQWRALMTTVLNLRVP